MAEAARTAYDLLGDEIYLAMFQRAYDGFHGRNSLNQPLADVQSGACCDGLHALGVNRNQGAESTFAYRSTQGSSAELLHLPCNNHSIHANAATQL